MTPQLPEPLPPELEEHLTRLLGQWANARRLSAARARSIREAVQENDAWEQSFWTRMSAVLTPAPAVIEHVPANPWSLALPIEPGLAQLVSQSDTPGFRPYLCLSA